MFDFISEIGCCQYDQTSGKDVPLPSFESLGFLLQVFPFSHTLFLFSFYFSLVGFTLERLAMGYRVYGRDIYLVILLTAPQNCLVSLHVLALAEASIFLPPLGFTPGMALRSMVVWVTTTLLELVEVGEWNSGVENLGPFGTEPRPPPPPPKDCSQHIMWLMWKEVSVVSSELNGGREPHSPFRQHIRFSEISQPCSKISTHPHFSLF